MQLLDTRVALLAQCLVEDKEMTCETSWQGVCDRSAALAHLTRVWGVLSSWRDLLVYGRQGTHAARVHDGSDLQRNGCNVGQQRMLVER